MGVHHVIIAVNKLDAVDFDHERFSGARRRGRRRRGPAGLLPRVGHPRQRAGRGQRDRRLGAHPLVPRADRARRDRRDPRAGRPSRRGRSARRGCPCRPCCARTDSAASPALWRPAGSRVGDELSVAGAATSRPRRTRCSSPARSATRPAAGDAVAVRAASPTSTSTRGDLLMGRRRRAGPAGGPVLAPTSCGWARSPSRTAGPTCWSAVRWSSPRWSPPCATGSTWPTAHEEAARVLEPQRRRPGRGGH